MNEQDLTKKLSGFRNIGIIALVVGGGALAVGFGQGMATFLQSYLFGWYFWMMVTMGCFGLLCLHNTVRGSWGTSILRMLEAGGGPEAIFLLGLGYLPIAANLGLIYPWAAPAAASDHLWQAKAFYLNPSFFLIRYAVYFAIWIFLAHTMRASSRKQDESLDQELGKKRMSVGPVALVIFFLTMTFATTDWIMSIERTWYSTILPLLSCVGGGLTALALTSFFLLSNREREPFHSIITPSLTKDLGNLGFALTMLWQYMTLSQFLIQYSANLAEEAPYYILRNAGPWLAVIAFVVVFQFFVPFTLLLFPRMKRYAKNLLAIMAWIFFVRIFDVYWTVMPSVRPNVDPMKNIVADLGAFLLFGGLWLAVFGFMIAKAAILPKHDTRLLEVAHAH